MPTPLGPLDRAAHRRKDPDFLQAQLRAPDTLLVPYWRELHAVRDGALVVPSVAAAGDLLEGERELSWLGCVGGRGCFAIDISDLATPLSHPALAGGTELVDLRFAAAQLPQDHTALAFYARALLVWHERHRFCGRCGAQTVAREGGHLRRCARGGCGLPQFPRTDPCVLVLVTRGDACLLARQPGWPAGMYSALAGFVEPGEDLEHAARREVREEVGLQLDDVCYESSQPWPFPASLMVGFTARAISTEIAFGADGELEDARFVPAVELANPRGFFVPPPFTLAGRLIAGFLREKTG